MQKPAFASASNEIVELLQEAKNRGHLVILRASPPSHVDAKAPLLIALNRLFGLTPAEGRALLELLAHGQTSRQALHAAMTPDGAPVSQIKTLDVVVYHMRRKLRPRGIEIITIPRLGYGLADGARGRIHKLLAEHDPELGLDQSEL